MNTREGRKIDPRVGTITKREMEFDDFTEQTQLIIEVGTPGRADKESEENQLKLLATLIFILFVILALTKFS
jgi:hypothetical protein